jgi:hypothetical protein
MEPTLSKSKQMENKALFVRLRRFSSEQKEEDTGFFV